MADFHSAEAADQAQADFDREVREGQQPDDMETVKLPVRGRNQLAQDLACGTDLADSRTDAERKIKAGAVEIDGSDRLRVVRSRSGANGAVIRVGKKWKRVQV